MTVRVRLLFADEGGWHHEEMSLPSSVLEGYPRLIDCLREEPEVLRRVYVDVDRLSAAWIVEDEAD